MKLETYKIATRETAIYPEAQTGSPIALAYCTLGLIGEIGEASVAIPAFTKDTPREEIDALEANFRAEIMDVVWYFARLVDELNLDIVTVATFPIAGTGALVDDFDKADIEYGPMNQSDTASRGSILLDMVLNASGLAGIVKKVIRDMDGKPSEATLALIQSRLGRLFAQCSEALASGALLGAFDQAAHANLEKLTSRKSRGVLGGDGDKR